MKNINVNIKKKRTNITKQIRTKREKEEYMNDKKDEEVRSECNIRANITKQNKATRGGNIYVLILPNKIACLQN